MITNTMVSSLVLSKLSGDAHTTIFEDADGWRFSVTAVNGLLLPTRLFVSRMLIELVRAPNDMRDHEANLMEVSALATRCGTEVQADVGAIDDHIRAFVKSRRREEDTSIEHFKEIIVGIIDGIDLASGNVISVETIPAVFSKTRPD